MSNKQRNPVNPAAPKRVAIVISNPGVSTTTGWPVGFWWAELTHPYFHFTEADYEVEVFSPDGGRCEADAMSDPDDESQWQADDVISRGYKNDPEFMKLVDGTRPVDELEVGEFDALVVAGGQGPMFTFERATNLQRKFVEFYEAGKVTALCHGVAILRHARLSNGEPLVRGRTVTGFANVEEDAADEVTRAMGALGPAENVMPWRIEDELKALGANFVQAGLWRGFTVRDGNLVTGQQNFSGGETAQLIIEAVGR
jgi:putative intracellular protease/amidase